MSDAKQALEAAVGKIAKAYTDLLKVAEKHGSDISKEDYEKAKFFLDSTIGKIWEKVDVVRDIAKATNGQFSLDDVQMPETVKIAWYSNYPDQIRPHSNAMGRPDPAAIIKPESASPIDPSKMDGRSLAKALGGRLSKAAQANMPQPEQSVNIDLEDGLGPDTSIEDKLLNDVDFIDD